MNTPNIRIEISRDISVLEIITNQYNNLVETADWINPYFSPEWMRSWWDRQEQNRKPLIILAISEDGSLLGYWPFTERPGLLGTKGLWPFIYDEANYHFPTCQRRVANLFVDTLINLLETFLFVWVPQIPEEFWKEHLEAGVKDSRNLKIVRSERTTTLINPETQYSFDQFWEEKIGKKSRKSQNYDERNLAGRGKVSYEVLESFEKVRSIMPATCLVEVESKKTRENAGLYTIRGKRGFFFELLPELAKSSQVRVSFLRVDDHPVAWQLELLSPGHSYLHHLAFDENWKKFSPGKQLLKHCIKYCWNEGRSIDFLPAFFDYKQDYANKLVPVYELHWIRRSVRGLIACRLINWNMQWRKKIRERSPGLAASIAGEQVKKKNSGFSE